MGCQLGCVIGSTRLRRAISLTLGLAAAVGITTSASAQPGWAVLPNDNIGSLTPFAGNSQFISGFATDLFGFYNPFFYDAESGLFRSRANQLTAPGELFRPVQVLDSGNVFGTYDIGSNDFGQTRLAPTEWNPTAFSGVFTIGAPPFLTFNAVLRTLSMHPDGRMAVGRFTPIGTETFRLARYFRNSAAGTSDSIQDIESSQLSTQFAPGFSTQVEQPNTRVFIISRGNGLYDFYGSWYTYNASNQVSSRTVRVLPLNSIGPAQDVLTNVSLFGLSNDATTFLVQAPGGAFQVMLRDGTVRQTLTGLPGFPIVKATGMSDDGRVIAGVVQDGTFDGNVLPGLPQGFPRGRAVVWRDGGGAEDLVTLLNSAGIAAAPLNSVPLESSLRLSPDGLRVAVLYPTPPFFQSPAQNRGSVAVATLPPKNDGCTNARPVTYGTYSDSLEGATSSMSSNTCFGAGDVNVPDVWYQFTPQQNETVRLDTCGSDIGTTLTVYRGSAGSCGTGAAPIACNRTSGTCAQNIQASRLDFNAAVGVPYFIRVAGFSGARGKVQLTVSAPFRPANDSCDGAINIDAGFSREFNTTGATTDARPGCPGATLPQFDLWYSTVSPDNGTMTFSTCGSAGNFVVSVYAADACGNPAAQPIACSGFTGCSGTSGGVVSVSAVRGQRFLLRVGGAFGIQGAGGRINTAFSCDLLNNLTPYAAGIAFAPIEQRPLAYWRFDDSGTLAVADAIRNDPRTCGNFPLTPTSLSKVIGAVGGAMVPNPVNLFTGARTFFAPSNQSNLTIEAWVRPDSADAGYIVDSRSVSGQTGAVLKYGVPVAGRLYFGLEQPGGEVVGASANVNLPIGQWSHVVGVRRYTGFPGFFDAWSLVVYVNGTPVGSTGVGGVQVVGPVLEGWTVGNRGFSPDVTTYFIGGIDEVAIYPYARTQDQIVSNIINQSEGCRPLFVPPPFLASVLNPRENTPYTVTLDPRSTRPIALRWFASFDGGAFLPLADGPQGDCVNVISGSSTASLTISNPYRSRWQTARIFARATTDCGSTDSPVYSFSIIPACLCPADFNCDGSRNTDDLTDFITEYFSPTRSPARGGPGPFPACPGEPAPFDCRGYAADFNADCLVNVDDISDFITAYFAGC